MSRPTRGVAVLDAAERWKNECLLGGRSLLSEQALWTHEHFEELRKFFVDRPDEGSRSFEEKLRDQLEPASSEATRLWAEITWIYFLLVSSVKGVTKLDKIKTVYEWSGSTLPEHHWALGEVLDKGICNPGTSYLVNQWREFRFIIMLMLDWTGHSERNRTSLLSDPWRFAAWLDELREGRQLQFRHAMLFLLFPDDFDPIVSLSHKKDIVKALGEETGEAVDVDRMSGTALDQALLAVRRRLEDQRPGQEVNFYDADFQAIWRSGSTRQNENVSADGTDDETWYRTRFGAVDVWTIAPGEGARLWREFLELGIAAIGWDDLDDLSEYESKDAIHGALIESGAGKNPFNQSLAVWEFVHEMKVGDIVVAKKGRNVILGWGTVTGRYRHDADRAEYKNLRTVEWHPCRAPINLRGPITTKTLTRFTAYKDWLRYVFNSVDANAGRPAVDAEASEVESYDVNTALDDLFLEDVQLRRILASIALRKNLILQGPPGVGKTFVAQRIAWCLIGRKEPIGHKNSRSIEMVQFHQSYAYEDFVQGWRPTEGGGFTLRDGAFLEFCKRAERHSRKEFVFIIDEINRGNVSRIFGELLMLIEADKRGGLAIPLTYSASGEPFSVPVNVHILGLMNTADRSLAIVDYALRRRFAFETLEPAYGSGKFREHLLEADVDPGLVDRIDRNLSALNETIRADRDLGRGFEIGHSYFMPQESADEQWYRSVVESQIAPLLREYWFDRPEQADQQTEKLLQ